MSKDLTNLDAPHIKEFLNQPTVSDVKGITKATIGFPGTSFIGKTRSNDEMATYLFKAEWLVTLSQAGRMVLYYAIEKCMFNDVILDDEADMILSLEARSKKINSVTIRRGINELLKKKILIEVSDTKRLYKWA